MTAVYVNPGDIAPQDNTVKAAAERRAVALWLVIEDEMPARRYAVDADQAWTHYNNAYDHCASAFETPGPSAGCYYKTRPGYVGDDKYGAHPMTADDLRKAEARYQRAFRRAEEAREARNAAVREAIAEHWTHAKISEATGLTRARIGQIALGRRP